MSELKLVGKPSTYSPQLAEDICRRLEAGHTLMEICESADMPGMQTVMDWATGETGASLADGFPLKYTRARRIQTERMGEEILAIADDSRNDYMDRVIDKEGNTVRVLDNEHVQRAKLRLDTRKWLLSKLRPETYGDRVAVQALDEHGKPARAGVTIVIDGAPAGAPSKVGE